MQHLEFLRMLRENIRIDDLVEMFLIQVVDREAFDYSGVDTVGTRYIIVQGHSEKYIAGCRGFRNFAQKGPVVPRNAHVALIGCVNYQNERNVGGPFRSQFEGRQKTGSQG